MILAALMLSGRDWTVAVVLGACLLVPLAFWSLQPAAPQRRVRAISLGLRCLGLGLLLLCLLDPQWTRPRPVPGANVLALLVDNSQGLRLTDAGADRPRGAILQNWLAPADAWLPALEELYQVRRYSFDRDVRREADFAALDFSGERTDLGAALAGLRQRFQGQPLAGVLLFTDGNATDLGSTIEDVAGLPPIFPVIVGQERGLRDLRVERAELRQTAFDDAPVNLRIDVAATGATSPAAVSVRPLAPSTGAETSPDLQQAVRWDADGRDTVEMQWRPTGSGVQFHEITLRGQGALTEATDLNNRRLVVADRGRDSYRILYVAGRMNWEYKFLNRALMDDPQLHLVALLRLAHREPKFDFRGRAGDSRNPFFRGFGQDDGTTRYDEPVLTRLNTRDATELRAGFPRSAEELFAYDAVVIDNLEASFFSPDQLQLLRQFVGDRGGGLLTLGGVDTLEDGGYHDTALAAALPVYLDRIADTSPRGELRWQLTREGWLQPWTRIRAEETEERRRLEAMPSLLVGNALAAVKPAATVLATFTDETGEQYPALVAQPFGRGRVATLAVGDLWRWGMQDPGAQADLARFWRQISRWLVTDVPAQVELVVGSATDSPRLRLRVTARTSEFAPLESAQVQISIHRIHSLDAPPIDEPAGAAEAGFQVVTLPAEPSPETPGQYEATFTPRAAGAYLARVTVRDRSGAPVGEDEAGWVHDPAAAEFASLIPNRTLLADLASKTGGAILELDQLPQLPERLVRTTAPVMEQTARPLWHNPWIFVAILGCFLAEWTWRRWKGLP